MANQILGRVRLRKNGKEYLSKRGATLNIGGKKRNPIVGSQKVHGFSEELVAPELEFSISYDSATDLVELQNDTNATILFEPDVGKKWVLIEAFMTDPPSIKESDGEVDLKYSATSCEQSA